MKRFDRVVFAFIAIAMVAILGFLPVQATAQGRVQSQGAQFGFFIEWNDPVLREDGTEFDPATEVGQYRVECVRGTDWTGAAFTTFTRDATAGEGLKRSYNWTNAVQVGGWYNCRMNVADVDDMVSDWSNTVVVRKRAKPTSPTLLGTTN